MIEYYIPIFFLLILSVIDIKTFNLREGFIPAALTTTFLIISFVLKLNIITAMLAFLIGMLLVDLDLFHGIPDWKVFVACGMVMPSIFHVLYFGLITTIVAVIYQVLVKKNSRLQEIPFIPALLIAYLGVLGIILI